jgi:hypothetical protein
MGGAWLLCIGQRYVSNSDVVGLILATIVHRFIWGAYVCPAFAPEEGE